MRPRLLWLLTLVVLIGSACAPAADNTARPPATTPPQGGRATAVATLPAYPMPGTPVPRPAATLAATPVAAEPEPRRLQLTAGAAPTRLEPKLAAHAIDRYVVRGQQGQRLAVKLASTQANILWAVNGVDGNVLKSSGIAAPDWFAVLPSTQDYLLSVFAEQGEPATYTLEVSLR